MSHQKVDSSFDPWLARVPRRPSESPVQSSGAHRTSVNTSARPGAEAGLTHSPVTSTAPLGTTPTSGTHWGRARGRPRLQQNEALSLLVGQAKGSPRSQYNNLSGPLLGLYTYSDTSFSLKISHPVGEENGEGRQGRDKREIITETGFMGLEI